MCANNCIFISSSQSSFVECLNKCSCEFSDETYYYRLIAFIMSLVLTVYYFYVFKNKNQQLSSFPQRNKLLNKDSTECSLLIE